MVVADLHLGSKSSYRNILVTGHFWRSKHFVLKVSRSDLLCMGFSMCMYVIKHIFYIPAYFACPGEVFLRWLREPTMTRLGIQTWHVWYNHRNAGSMLEVISPLHACPNFSWLGFQCHAKTGSHWHRNAQIWWGRLFWVPQLLRCESALWWNWTFSSPDRMTINSCMSKEVRAGKIYNRIYLVQAMHNAYMV